MSGPPEPVGSIARSVGAADLFIYRRVSADRFVHVGGVGRGEGWAGNLELLPGEQPEVAAALDGSGLVRFAAPGRRSVLGPYYAREAVLVPVSHDVLVLFGNPEEPLPERSDAELRAAAEAAAGAIEFVSPAKRLADELEVLTAVEALMSVESTEVQDVLQHIVDVAASSLSCELGILYLAEREQFAVARRGWPLEAGDEAVVQAMRELRSQDNGHARCVQDAAAEPLPEPFRSGVRSYYVIPLGRSALGALLLIHTDAVPRGFTTLCRQLGVRLADSAEALVRAALMRELEVQMQQAQKLESLGVLAGGIAHDFNNLLVGVLGNAELALNELPPHAAARSRLEQIQKAAHRAAELSRLMLVYSGRGCFERTSLDLSEVVEEIGQLLESAISKKAVVRFQLAPGLGVEADVAQLRQVIMNLITNASEALADEAGVVTVRTSVVAADRALLARYTLGDEAGEGHYACLEVSDTGSGMDAATEAKLFEPFFSRKFAGRGLGLAAVLGIVRGHRGAIGVRSEPGQGTTFSVLLPLAERAQEPQAADVPARREWNGAGTVLVADDEGIVRDVTAAMLEEAGFTVVTAGDGLEAVRTFSEREEQIVAVVLDLTMPGMGGEEALGELRRGGSRVPVLLASGYSDRDGGPTLAEDRVGFVQKPYAAADLIGQLRALLTAA